MKRFFYVKVISLVLVFTLMMGINGILHATGSSDVIDVATTAPASGQGWVLSDGIINIAGDVTITGITTVNRVIIQGGTAAEPRMVTLKDVAISSASPFVLSEGACAVITLEGKNIISATSGPGIQTSNAFLTIEAESVADELSVKGGYYGAGIGGSHNGSDGGTVTINGGTITSTGGGGAAGIGGSMGYDGSRSNIYGGPGGTGGTITINGGSITSTGGVGAAGIGGGMGGRGANGESMFSAAGGNGGVGGNGGTIRINGGNVVAIGGLRGVGIGGGAGGDGGVREFAIFSPSKSGNGGNGGSGSIVVDGGNVYAVGSSGGVGIGGGIGGNGGSDIIDGPNYGSGGSGGTAGIRLISGSVQALSSYSAINGGNNGLDGNGVSNSSSSQGSFSGMLLPLVYRYWTNDTPSDPGGLGRVYYNDDINTRHIFVAFYKYIRINALVSISLSETEAYVFPDAIYGYSAQTEKYVTISNTGTMPTDGLEVVLSGDADAFFLTSSTIGSIAPGGMDMFTISPAKGLAAGKYAATVTVTGEAIIPQSFEIAFTVIPISLSINPLLYPSETLTLYAKPSSTIDGSVTWISSDPDVATVSQSGLVTAVAPGEVIIAAIFEEAEATFAITVRQIIEETLTISQTKAEINVNESLSLSAVANPVDASYQVITWTSSNTSVATVSSSGLVTAVALGEAIIAANTRNGLTATCVVTVRDIHTVVFVDWDGTVLDIQEIQTGSDAAAPAAPSRPDYTFNGWDVDFSSITDNLTVTAMYRSFVFMVSFYKQSQDGNNKIAKTPFATQQVTHKEMIDFTKISAGKNSVWYITDGTTYGAKFDTKTPITSDLKLAVKDQNSN